MAIFIRSATAVSAWAARLAVHAVGLLGLLVAVAGAAEPPRLGPDPHGTDLAGEWRFMPGDDPAWADPAFDDSGWPTVPVPGPWGRNGYEDHHGLAWYRLGMDIGPDAPGALGLRLGQVESAYEVYAGGRKIGQVGSLPPDPKMMYDRHAVHPIPRSAIDEQGRVVVAVRVWLSPLQRGTQGGLTSHPVLVGEAETLRRDLLVKDLAPLVLVLLYLIVGAYHLYVSWRRPALREYFWFGSCAVAIGVYSFLRTDLKYEITESFALLKNLEYLALFGLSVPAGQFFWSLFDRPVPRAARAIQILHGGMALLAGFSPGLAVNLVVISIWEPTALVAIGLVLQLILQERRAGHPEARLITGAWVVLALTMCNDIAVNRGLLMHPRLMHYGFAVLVFAMAGSLAKRFLRSFAEIETLNVGLESRVREQTLALEERASELEVKNKELEDTYEQLRRASLVDPLTGLSNRRFFQEHIEFDVSRAIRQHENHLQSQAPGAPSSADLVFLLLDLDHFKSINDRFGHPVGDQALSRVADCLRDVCRGSDYLIRWGGEEFLIVSRFVDREGAPILAERIRGEIERIELEAGGRRVGPITCSIGFSCFPLDPLQPAAAGFERAVGVADWALYQAKRRGRNGWAGSLRASGPLEGVSLADLGRAGSPIQLELRSS